MVSSGISRRLPKDPSENRAIYSERVSQKTGVSGASAGTFAQRPGKLGMVEDDPWKARAVFEGSHPGPKRATC